MKKLAIALMGILLAGAASAALVTGNLTQASWLLSAATDAPTMSQTVDSGANYLIATVTSEDVANMLPMTSMTYGTQTMTLLGSVLTTTGYNSISYYVLANPTAGTANLVGDRASTTTGTGYGLSFSAWTVSGGANSLSFFSSTSYAAATPLSSAINVTNNGSLVIASYTGRNAGRLTSSTFFGVTPPAFNNGTFAANNMPTGGTASYDAWSFIKTGVATGSYTVDITSSDARSAMGGIIVSSAVPEPATIGMLGLGALVTLLIRRFRA